MAYLTRSQAGGSYAHYTPVSTSTVTRLPEGVTTQAAAAVLLQGLTALSMVKVTCEVKPGENVRMQQTVQCVVMKWNCGSVVV